MPAQLSARHSKEELLAENRALRDIIDRCCYQMQRDYALKKLMENENGTLRDQLFNKQGKQKKKQTTSYARHMTSEECMEALAMEDWKGAMRAVFGTEEFKAQKKRVEAECRQVEAEAKEAEKRVERERKEEDKRVERERKEEEKQVERERKEEEKREKDAQKEAEKIEKAAQRKRDQEEKARVRKEEAERKKREKEEEKKRKQKATGGKKPTAPAKKRQSPKGEEATEAEEDNVVPAAPEPSTPARSRLYTPTVSSAARIRSPHVPVTVTRPPKPRPITRSANVDKGDRDDADMFIIRRSRHIQGI